MIETKTCTACGRCLSVAKFNVRRDRKTLQFYSQCIECKRLAGRHRHLMSRPSQAQRIWKSQSVRENNAFNLWHGPVSREQPLRWAA